MRSRRVRAVTLNTWKNEGDYHARIGAMAAGLRALAPDIVLLQEVFRTADDDTHTGRALAQRLGLTLAYAPARAKLRRWGTLDVPSESGLAILFRGRLSGTQVVALPSDEPGGERIALFAQGQLASGLAVTVGCTHLAHLREDSLRRRQQLEAVLSRPEWFHAAELRILGGDFNATAEMPELTWLAQYPALRVVSALGHDMTVGPTHPLPPREGRNGRCIDFLFALSPRDEPAPWIAHAAVALREPVDSVWPSDHAAVVMDLEPAG